ncbi:MAG TPA: SPOR domain-containing protein [Spirochaetia bacterium]|nr:SPOR domain-containing protein [Spirochaetia bacterium]
MEKQKVFWVVLAVSVFVVVVLIVGVLLLRQHPAGSPRATVTPMNDSGSQVYEYQRETPLTPPPGGQPGTQAGGQGTQSAAPGASGTQPGGQPGDQQTLHFYIGEGAPSAGGASTGTASGAPAPAAPGTSSATGPSSPAASPAPSPSVPPAVSSARAAVRPKAARPSAASATPSSASASRKVTQYWIQAGAYKSQDKAEELVKLLDGKGISSRVFSYAQKSETWYRVRVGPYANRGEAGKFLSLVKQVQGLEASYISLVPVSRSSVN